MKREKFCFFRYISTRSTIIQRQMKYKGELERDGATTDPHRVPIYPIPIEKNSVHAQYIAQN